MIKDKRKVIIAAVVIITIVVIIAYTRKSRIKDSEKTSFINPIVGEVTVTVSTTGVVEPQNRLEIKPSISGRVESILVKEGDPVTEGQILAWMSSTERAALVDAARSQGEETLLYWEEAYKKTPIISPINGEVIVRSIEPGQTVTTQEALLVLSDRLVVSAQFDETDIARVKVGQPALIMLDAYPDVNIEGAVDHIAYESNIVNNVTIYDVDILPTSVPEILRSGMSVTVEVIEKAKSNVLTIPSNAIHYENARAFVFVKDKNGKITERDISVGLNNDKAAEIISGINQEDSIVVQGTQYLPQKKDIGTNPFMPSRRR